MTGDMGELFNEYRKGRREKRAKNRDDSAAILREHSVGFIEHNGGSHLVITSSGKTIDFWPGTGLWICRASSKRGRGVFNLLKYLP